MSGTTKITAGLLIFSAVLAGVFFAGRENESDIAAAFNEGELLRLHIIANSNSEVDQRLKLAVRDAVIEEFALDMASAKSGEVAEQILSANGGRIKKAAELAGFSGEIRVEYGDFHFPDRIYSGTLLPDGIYRAVRIVLGEGLGENWWCVMYPPLCFIGTDADAKLWQQPDIKFESYFAKLLERLKAKPQKNGGIETEVIANGE